MKVSLEFFFAITKTKIFRKVTCIIIFGQFLKADWKYLACPRISFIETPSKPIPSYILLQYLLSVVVISGAGNVKAGNINWVETQKCDLHKSEIVPKLTIWWRERINKKHEIDWKLKKNLNQFLTISIPIISTSVVVISGSDKSMSCLIVWTVNS